MSLTTAEQNSLDEAIDGLVALRESLESRSQKARCSKIITKLEELAAAHEEQLTLIDIFPEDGEVPDEEHQSIVDAYEIPKNLDLEPLNVLLARCVRPARAEIVDADDEDYDDDLEELVAAEDAALDTARDEQ